MAVRVNHAWARCFIFLCILFLLQKIIAENLLLDDTSFENGNNSDWVTDGACFGEINTQIDCTSAADGNASIKIEFPRPDWSRSKPFIINDGNSEKTLTFSLYAKSDSKNAAGRLYVMALDWSSGIRGNVQSITKNWKRYSVTGKLKKGSYYLGFEAVNPCSLWLDAFQLEARETPSGYKNNAKIGINIKTHSINNKNVFLLNEKICLLILARDMTNKGLLNGATLFITISDYQKNVKFQTTSQAIDKDSIVVCYEFPSLEPGWFKIKAELKRDGHIVTEKQDAICIVNPPLVIEKGKIPFCGISGGYHRFPELDLIGGGNMEESFFRWSEIEIEPGKYKWPAISHTPGHLYKLTVTSLPSAPQWTWNPSEVADCQKRGIIQARAGLLPSGKYMKDWQKFIRELVIHYKGQIDIIEIGGEDDLTFACIPYYLAKYSNIAQSGKILKGPAYTRYMEMIKTACEEIRKTDPTLKIGIIRPSGSDSDRKPIYSFSSPVIKYCSDLFDFFPLDCYCHPRYLGPKHDLPKIPEDFLFENLTKALDICRQNGNGQKVYISEIGYAMDYDTEPDSIYSLEMVKRLARMHLIARMTTGCEAIHWFSSNFCIEGGKYHYGLWRFGMPLPSVPAYSAVTRIIENVEESKELTLGGDSKAVVFKKTRHADAAVWFVRGNGKLIIDNLPQNISISDVMGNCMHIETPSIFSRIIDSILLKKSKTIINISEFPVYFSLDDDDAFNKLTRILSNAEMKCKPLKISFSTPRADKGMLQLKNLTGKDINATVTVNESTKNIFLPQKQTSSMEIPICKTPATFDISIACGSDFDKIVESYNVKFEQCTKIDIPVKIDGDLTEWQHHPFITMNERNQILPPDPWIDYKGPSQFSAKVYTGWDDKYFYMAAEVKDEIHSNKFPAGEIWKGDCIQFALDPLSDANSIKAHQTGYGEDDYELGLAYANNKATFAQWSGKVIWKNAEYAVKRDEQSKKTFYEIRLPLKNLGIEKKEGTVFGFNFIIPNDNTGGGANYYYQFAPGITGGKNPALFKKLVLSK